MRNLKLIALTAATTITLLGAPFTSMAAGSYNTTTAPKSYGITISGNKSGGNNAQSIIDYVNGKSSTCKPGQNCNGTNTCKPGQSCGGISTSKPSHNCSGTGTGTCKPGHNCSGTNTTPAPPSKPGISDNSNSGSANSGSTITSSSQYAQQVVNLVNAERAKKGLSPVSVDTKVENAAQTRAKEIVTSFSHTRPNGSSFSTALKAAGVNYNGSGENIAYGQKSPEAVMNDWMNSPGHRANIMKPNFKYIGVGSYQINGVNYWVQLFTY